MFGTEYLFWNNILKHYPQHNWSQAILQEIEKLDLDNDTVIYDAPCGNGAISFWLNKKLSQNFELHDNSHLFSKIVELWSKDHSNIEIKKTDIFDVEHEKSDDVWLLINSLYLFEKPERLMEQNRKRFKYIIGIFPYLQKENYQYFLKRPFSNENKAEWCPEETIDFFKINGYKLTRKCDVTAIPFFKYELFGIAAFSRYILSLIDRDFSPENGQYWLGVFVRK